MYKSKYAAAIAALVALASPASATVLLSQLPSAAGGGVVSSPINGGGSAHSFDDFKLAANSTISSITWFGESLSGGTSFTIGFSTDASQFFPSTTPFVSQSVTPTITSFASGIDQFTATLATPISLEGGTDLWITIFDPSGFFWVWDRATDAPSPGALPSGIAATEEADGSVLLQGLDLAFTLDGDVALPEPGMLAMLGFGLTAIAWFRRRGRLQSGDARMA